jgi:hypothetical protein
MKDIKVIKPYERYRVYSRIDPKILNAEKKAAQVAAKTVKKCCHGIRSDQQLLEVSPDNGNLN